MSDVQLAAALERLRTDLATGHDERTLRDALVAGQIVVGSHNVTAGRDIIGSNILQIDSAEAMERLLRRLFPRHVNTLPPAPAHFTGRAAELTRVQSILGRAPVLIGGFRGMGGVGKTASALVVAHQLAPRYPDAALYLDLRGASNDPLSLRDAQIRIVHVLDEAAVPPDDPAALSDLYRRTLADTTGLLLLDDARDATLIRQLRPPTTWALLVTSRQRFGLDGLEPIDLTALPAIDGRLLLQRIVPYPLTDPQAERIVRLCGGLPLALTLAGRALQSRDPAYVDTYLRRLSDETRRIERLDATLQLDPGQPGIEATLQISCDLLSPDLQARWRALSIFPASFDAHAAAVVWGLLSPDDDAAGDEFQDAIDDADDLLGTLNQYSLIEPDAAGRWAFHDLARVFANRDLADDAREDAGLRHARLGVSLLQQASAAFDGGSEGVLAALAVLDREWPTITAGQIWSADRAATSPEAARLVMEYPISGGDALRLRLRAADLVTWLTASVEAARSLADRRTEGVALLNLGASHLSLGEIPQAVERYQQSLPIAVELGDRRTEALTLVNLGGAHYLLGEARRAIEYFQQSLPIIREIGDRRLEGRALLNLGNPYLTLGDTGQAAEHYQQCLDIAVEIGDRITESQALLNLSNAHLNNDEADRAIEYAQRSLPIAVEIGARRAESQARSNLGGAYLSLGDARQAIEQFEQSLSIAVELGDRYTEANTLVPLGGAYLTLGEAHQGMEHLQRGLTIAVEIGDRACESEALVRLGDARQQQDDRPGAIEAYLQALAIQRGLGARQAEAATLTRLGDAYLAAGDRTQADEMYEQARAIQPDLAGHAAGSCGPIQRDLDDRP